MTTVSSGKATLYIRKSPNATASKALINISAKSDCTGDFLNTNTSHNLFKYSMDEGCDWIVEASTKYTEDEVRERLASQTGFVGELSEGKYYRVISYYGRALIDTEAVGGDMSTQPIDANDISQYWTLTKDGDKWKFENVLTQRLLLKQTTTSAPFHTTTKENATKFNLSVSSVVTQLPGDGWDYTWTINFPDDSRGLHDSESYAS